MKTSIKHKLNIIDVQLIAYKMEINSNYGTNVTNVRDFRIIRDKIVELNSLKRNLTLIKIRTQKIEKIWQQQEKM
jgi:hypothetical protein